MCRTLDQLIRICLHGAEGTDQSVIPINENTADWRCFAHFRSQLKPFIFLLFLPSKTGPLLRDGLFALMLSGLS